MVSNALSGKVFTHMTTSKPFHICFNNITQFLVMDIIAQFAKVVCNRKISLQEIEQSGNQNPDPVFGVLANEIFGQNNLNNRLNLYLNLKQNRNGFRDSLVNKIVHHDKRCKTLVAERVSASDGNEPLVTHIISALTTEKLIQTDTS